MLESIICFHHNIEFIIHHADFYEFFKYRLFNQNSRKSTENVCVQWKI